MIEILGKTSTTSLTKVIAASGNFLSKYPIEQTFESIRYSFPTRPDFELMMPESYYIPRQIP